LKAVTKYLFLLIPMFASVFCTEAKAQINSVMLAPEQSCTVRTAASVTTRITFPEKVTSVICGDLYDPATGKGTFVVQKEENGSDVFIKPVAPKGQTNMFIKTADGRKTYNFDIIVVPFNQAHRVINVLDPKPSPENPADVNNTVKEPRLSEADLEKRKAEIEQAAQDKADEIIRKARENATRITSDAEARAAETERQSASRSSQETERRFIQAMLGGVQRTDVKTLRAEVKKVVFMLDANLLTFDGKSYLRYTFQNTSDKDFTFAAIAMESGALKASQTIPVDLTQSKPANSLAPTETLSGVVAFDAKLVTAKDRLVFIIRGEDNLEIARLIVQ
jgi:vacuolar-type H+-ATPase subunit H